MKSRLYRIIAFGQPVAHGGDVFPALLHRLPARSLHFALQPRFLAPARRAGGLDIGKIAVEAVNTVHK